MSVKKLLPLFVLFFLACIQAGYSQINDDDVSTDLRNIDSLRTRGLLMVADTGRKDIILSQDEALRFLQRSYQPHLWKNIKDPFRTAIGQIIFRASNLPFDSARSLLMRYPYDSIKVKRDDFFIWEPIRFRIPLKATEGKPADSLLTVDSLTVEAKRDTAFQDVIKSSVEGKTDGILYKDTTLMVIVDTLDQATSSYSGFPFRYYHYPYQGDSIQAAVSVILDAIEARDSSILSITGLNNKKTSIWLNSRSDLMVRYWLKNDLNDSVTVWIGSPERNTIGLYLEHGVIFRRPPMQGNISGARVNVESQDKSTLQDIRKIVTKTNFWKHRTEAILALNQGLLSNWVKGGESNITTAFDVTWYADYLNKPYLVSANNFVRLKYGLIASTNNGVRTNLDLFETNSKLNHKAFGKFDFSATALFKTQITKGYDYPNDSIPVSKFINPATLTLGLGLDYKPNKLTSINVSPLSYKATFVPDTVMIDQTKYGVAEDRKSKHEPGASVLISHEFKPIKTITVKNRLQLFTNYIHNPQNIDVDWEMILVASLNWFTDIRLNTHLIFDDDTKTLLYTRDRDPVFGPDGLQKKTARIQFKELLGLSLVFRF
ncbi:MAG: DUF3078 domain-containing protein [Bacteroidales bacterium]|nr:DUF3078 domain-containing protein [Bacteroidales bacterium]